MSGSPSEAPVTVVVPTRNRGDAVIDPIESLLANDTTGLLILVVDQSTNDDTAQAMQRFGDDPRVERLPTTTTGASRARNLGLAAARSDVVLFTDDDCVVPANWVTTMVDELEAAPDAGLVYCSVAPGPHDASVGTIPNHVYTRRRTMRSVWSAWRSIGMSAGLAGRRDVLLQLDGFDPSLGPGSVHQCAEDHDLALRALSKGIAVIETPATEVVHLGYRTFSEFRALTDRDWFGLGACHAKHAHLRTRGLVGLVGYNLIVRATLAPLRPLLMLRRPAGLRRLPAYARGFVAGWRVGVDRSSGFFTPAEAAR